MVPAPGHLRVRSLSRGPREESPTPVPAQALPLMGRGGTHWVQLSPRSESGAESAKAGTRCPGLLQMARVQAGVGFQRQPLVQMFCSGRLVSLRTRCSLCLASPLSTCQVDTEGPVLALMP